MANTKFSINKETLLIRELNDFYLIQIPGSHRQLYTVMSKRNLFRTDDKTLYFEFGENDSLPVFDKEPTVNQIADYIQNPQNIRNGVNYSAQELYKNSFHYEKYYNERERMEAEQRRNQRQQEILKKIENNKRQSDQRNDSQQNPEQQNQGRKQKPEEQQIVKPSAQENVIPKELTEQEKWEQYRASIKHYSKEQFREIKRGMRQHVNTKLYQDIHFSAKQMKELRLALKSNIDITSWNSPYVSVEKMKELRLGAKHGIRFDLNKIDHHMYTAAQLKEIRLGFEKNLPVKQFLNPAYSAQQMHEIRIGQQMGLDVSKYSDIRFTLAQMQSIRREMVFERIKDILMQMWHNLQEVLSNVVHMTIEKTQAYYTHREIRTPEQIKEAHIRDAIDDIKYTLVESELLTEAAMEDQELEFNIREKIMELVNEMENQPESSIESVAEETSHNIQNDISEKNLQEPVSMNERIDAAIDDVMDQVQVEEAMEIETWEMQM